MNRSHVLYTITKCSCFFECISCLP